MIIVDDRLALEALAGHREQLGARSDETVATTWGFHYRLARALSDGSRRGRLSGQISEDLIAHAVSPRPEVLAVLDPRTVTQVAAAAAMRHGLNLLAAELVGHALHHEAVIVLSAANVGRSWPDVFDAEGISMRIVE